MANNSNNGNMFDPYGIAEMFQQIMNINQGRQESLVDNEGAKEIHDLISDLVKNSSKMTEKEITTATKALRDKIEAIFGGNAKLTKAFKEFENEVLKMSKQMAVNTDVFSNRAHAFFALLAKLTQNGEKLLNFNKKGITSNLSAQIFMRTYLPQQQKIVNGAMDKLLAFLGADRDRRKVWQKQFKEDLIEGLAKSKFIGGAFVDLIRLGSLFAASWLKDKGPLAKALAVGLVAGAPILAAALAKAVIGGLATLLTNTLSRVATLIFTPIKWVGGKIGTWIGQIMNAIWASKALSGVRGGLASLGLGGKGKALSTVAKAGSALTPAATAAAGGAVIAGGATKVAPAGYKALASGLLVPTALGNATKAVPPSPAVTAPLKGILGIAAKTLPWILRLGKLFNVVGWIWLGIEAIVGIVKWWKNRKGNKDGKGRGASGSDNIGVSDVSDQGASGESTGGSQKISESSGTLGGRQVTSSFGWRTHPVYGDRRFHSGIDLAYNKGEAVNALMGGKVISAQWQQGYGNTVRVQDKNGYVHLYGHLDSLGVKPGQTIKRGQYLGAAGMTGTATGVHTHYGVAKDDSWAQSSWVDPLAYLGAHEPDALKKGEKSGLVYKDKTTKNIVDYWDSRGKDKGFLHSKAKDYAKLAEQFKEEYVKKVAKIDSGGYLGGDKSLKYAEDRAIAITSQEAKDYANKRMADYVAKAKSEAVAKTTSIRVNQPSTREKAQEVKDATASATEQANAQWSRINKDFKEDANKQTIIHPEKHPILDFAGTEACSKVLQNTLNAQQQAYQQY